MIPEEIFNPGSAMQVLISCLSVLEDGYGEHGVMLGVFATMTLIIVKRSVAKAGMEEAKRELLPPKARVIRNWYVTERSTEKQLHDTGPQSIDRIG